MHISEGILPASWAGLWGALAIPFVAWGLRDLKRRSQNEPAFKRFVGLVGAAVFLISCMPIPIPTAGTCSHPCGTGLAAILIGPGLTVVVASIALTLQALFLAHGGLTTLGANILSMGVAGAYIGYGTYWIGRRLGLHFLAAAARQESSRLGDLCRDLPGAGSRPSRGRLLFGDVLPDPPGLRPDPDPPGSGRGGPLRRGTEVHQKPQARTASVCLGWRGVMKRMLAILFLAGFLWTWPGVPDSLLAGSWPGVDEAVIEKLAEKAGRPAREPFINTDQGDLLLFAFLLAGIVGGFVGGYHFRALFPPRRSGEEKAEKGHPKEGGERAAMPRRGHRDRLCLNSSPTSSPIGKTP
jgi:cobalt/nickel transport system permease protein